MTDKQILDKIYRELRSYRASNLEEENCNKLFGEMAEMIEDEWQKQDEENRHGFFSRSWYGKSN